MALVVVLEGPSLILFTSPLVLTCLCIFPSPKDLILHRQLRFPSNHIKPTKPSTYLPSFLPGFVPPGPIILPPVIYSPGTPLSGVTLPVGFIPLLPLTVGSTTYPAAVPFTEPVDLPDGFDPLFPLIMGAATLAAGAALARQQWRQLERCLWYHLQSRNWHWVQGQYSVFLLMHPLVLPLVLWCFRQGLYQIAIHCLICPTRVRRLHFQFRYLAMVGPYHRPPRTKKIHRQVQSLGRRLQGPELQHIRCPRQYLLQHQAPAAQVRLTLAAYLVMLVPERRTFLRRPSRPRRRRLVLQPVRQ